MLTLKVAIVGITKIIGVFWRKVRTIDTQIQLRWINRKSHIEEINDRPLLLYLLVRWRHHFVFWYFTNGPDWPSTGCQKKVAPPTKVFWLFPKRLGIFRPNFTCLLYVHIYDRVQIFIQLTPTVTKLCHIKCDHPACVSADGRHFEHYDGGRLIWHNFVKVADNWIKFSSPAYIETYNRHVKFGLKISNRLGKNARKP